MNYTYIQMKTLKMGKTKRTKRIKIINIRAEINKIKIKKIADVNKASGYFLEADPLLTIAYQLVSIALQSL